MLWSSGNTIPLLINLYHRSYLPQGRTGIVVYGPLTHPLQYQPCSAHRTDLLSEWHNTSSPYLGMPDKAVATIIRRSSTAAVQAPQNPGFPSMVLETTVHLKPLHIPMNLIALLHNSTPAKWFTTHNINTQSRSTNYHSKLALKAGFNFILCLCFLIWPSKLIITAIWSIPLCVLHIHLYTPLLLVAIPTATPSA